MADAAHRQLRPRSREVVRTGQFQRWLQSLDTEGKAKVTAAVGRIVALKAVFDRWNRCKPLPSEKAALREALRRVNG